MQLWSMATISSSFPYGFKGNNLSSKQNKGHYNQFKALIEQQINGGREVVAKGCGVKPVGDGRIKMSKLGCLSGKPGKEHQGDNECAAPKCRLGRGGAKHAKNSDLLFQTTPPSLAIS